MTSWQITRVELRGVGRITVVGILDDGAEHPICSFYDDEIHIDPNEFCGKTIEEAKTLLHERDLAYLRR
ncbi:MAG: hypothetical protein Q8O67_22560 [Deltaproteobacteria bacterium]|nr:hypothetical protein [Deltaproteobacteria bacterium]